MLINIQSCVTLLTSDLSNHWKCKITILSGSDYSSAFMSEVLTLSLRTQLHSCVRKKLTILLMMWRTTHVITHTWMTLRDVHCKVNNHLWAFYFIDSFDRYIDACQFWVIIVLKNELIDKVQLKTRWISRWLNNVPIYKCVACFDFHFLNIWKFKYQSKPVNDLCVITRWCECIGVFIPKYSLT